MTVERRDGTPPDPRSGVVAGYSGTPLFRKLGVRPGHQVVVVGAPESFPLDLLSAEGTARVDARGGLAEAASPAEVVLAFCPDAATLAAVLGPATASTREPGGRCWIGWPKRASKIPTDLTEDVVRAAALGIGWVDVKVCALDRLWSGLCLMRRTRSAPGTQQRRRGT
ncbi:MAG TPA: hypothetical protein VI248_25265 [Kineosporiaceae bacterium]